MTFAINLEDEIEGINMEFHIDQSPRRWHGTVKPCRFNQGVPYITRQPLGTIAGTGMKSWASPPAVQIWKQHFRLQEISQSHFHTWSLDIALRIRSRLALSHSQKLSVSNMFAPVRNTQTGLDGGGLGRACRRQDITQKACCGNRSVLFCLHYWQEFPNLVVSPVSYVCWGFRVNNPSSFPSQVCVLPLSRQSHDRNVVNTPTCLLRNSPCTIRE